MAIDQNLKNLLMENDPFYQAGMIDIANVKPFEADPRLQYQAAPLFTGVNPTALAAKKEKDFGYTRPGDPSLYVRDLDKPTMETAGTVTHEGLHKILPQELKDAVARDAGSALGPLGTYSSWDDWYKGSLERINEGATYEEVKADTPSKAVTGADFAREEIITRYLENQIYGDEVSPFEEWMGGVEPYDNYFNYITMDRPGQGPLGLTGIKKILAKRGMPYLKKIAKRAHQNIESRYKPPIKPPTNVPGTPIVPTGGGGVSNINIQKKKIGMPEHLTYTPPSADPPSGNGGGMGKGRSPTGGDIAGTPFVRGGYVDRPLSGRSRYI